MALLSQLVLDTLLLKEQGLYGMLNLTETECTITIHSAISSVEKAWAKVKEMANQTSEFFQSLQPKIDFRKLAPIPG